MPSPATGDDSGDCCMQATKEHEQQSIHPHFETHGQSHLKSETEGAIGPTKWTSVQQKLKKKLLVDRLKQQKSRNTGLIVRLEHTERLVTLT